MATKLHESLKVPIRGGVKHSPEIVLRPSMDPKNAEDELVTKLNNGEEIYVHREEHNINQKVNEMVYYRTK